MSFSYADAMKSRQKSQVVDKDSVPSQKLSNSPAPESITPKVTQTQHPAMLLAGGNRENPQSQQKSSHQQHQKQQEQSRSAWGAKGNHSAASSKLPVPNFNHTYKSHNITPKSDSTTSAWKIVKNDIKNPNSNSAVKQQKIASQKNTRNLHPRPTILVKRKNSEGTSKLGNAHPKPQLTVVATNNATNNEKKAKAAPKQNLNSLSMLDVNAKPMVKTVVGKSKNKNYSKPINILKSPAKQPQLMVDSIEDFPALGTKSNSVKSSDDDALNANTEPKAIWQKSQNTPASVTSSSTTIQNVTNPFKGKLKAKGDTTNQKKEKGVKENNNSTKNKCKVKSSPQTTSGASLPAFFQPLQRSTQPVVGTKVISSSTTNNLALIDRNLEGEEHQLLRLVQERTLYETKGRQRVAPRKKKFTALKKRVLQERLDKWRALHPEFSARDTTFNNASSSTGVGTIERSSALSSSVCIYNYSSVEELEDDDEYDEITENVRSMAEKVGPVAEIHIPRNRSGHCDMEENETHPVFVKFKTVADAAAARACWNDLVVGGNRLKVISLDLSMDDDEIPWSERVVLVESKHQMADQSINHSISTSSDIFLQKILTDDDYSDEDCMQESLEDLRRVASQHAELLNIRPSDDRDGNVVLTFQCDNVKATEIAQNLCQTVVGGKPLYAFVKQDAPTIRSSPYTTVLLDNILNEDDLSDKECLAETLNDIRELSQRYGEVYDIVVRDCAVKVTYRGGRTIGEKAASELNGVVLGGNVVEASLASDDCNYVILGNFLTQDDLEDEDCLEESLNDIRELVSKYGVVSGVDVFKEGESAEVRIHYSGGSSVASNAARQLDGMVLGGQICTATCNGGNLSSGDHDRIESSHAALVQMSGDKRKSDYQTSGLCILDKKARTNNNTPLFSGDKLIPERFAEMKRVPKIPNVSGPRDYAGIVNDERVKPLLIEMLGELMRLQKRASEEKNTKARRRIVMGLREVARGIRAHKVKMVIMANNLDQYGVIEEKLQEIIDTCKAEDVPLFFEFTKRSLGKALGKNIKIAVVGIQSADGAYQPFKQLNKIAATTGRP